MRLFPESVKLARHQCKKIRENSYKFIDGKVKMLNKKIKRKLLFEKCEIIIRNFKINFKEKDIRNKATKENYESLLRKVIPWKYRYVFLL